ncbi:MAG: hypothetical protein NTV87_05105 [Ignavibacteriae bacterium]|nr:hypothetical protein [Ignavibacteriota bacterium]
MKKIFLVLFIIYPALLLSQEGIYIKSIKFYPSRTIDNIDENSREYSEIFKRSSTCLVNYEVVVDVEQRTDKDKFINIKATFYNTNSKLLEGCAINYDVAIDKYKNLINSTGYCGFEEPGYWETGSYRVDIILNGISLKSATFEIKE